ncbi:MAG: hypothetical protein L6R35_006983 [Caloplaca aegaea]|nr:MAG: hypothetical protein L6R35_006983 [Caloplaca aegaea]
MYPSPREQQLFNYFYLTLPFDPIYIDYGRIVKPTIQRSLANPEWFLEGRRRDPAFGTLSYLPVEIRCLIWKNLVQWTTRPTAGLPPMWMISPYAASEEQVCRRLREALPIVALEIDHVYLATTNLRFDSYKDVSTFWSQSLAPWQIPWIRHLSLNLGVGRDHDWIQWFWTDLPPNLKTITLDFNHDHGIRERSEYSAAMKSFCPNTKCTLRPRDEKGEEQLCKHMHKFNFLDRKLDRDLALLEVVTKIIARSIPTAAVMLGPTDRDWKCGFCHRWCKTILEDLEK